jgi:type IV pilus assembly protein PilX
VRRCNAQVRGAKRQRGAILLVSLVMLLILTLLGVGAMDTSVMELKMTSNYREQIQALNAAESNLRFAEIDIENIISDSRRFDFNTADDGYYDSRAALANVHDWSELSTVAGAGSRDSYIVEYIGTKYQKGASIAIDTDGGTPGDYIHAYVITASSMVGKGAARTVQAAYSSFDAP